MATRKTSRAVNRMPRTRKEPRATYRAEQPMDPHRARAVEIIAEEIARAYGTALRNLSKR